MCDDIIEVDVLVAPFEIVDDALVCKLFLDDEQILEEINYSLVDVEVVELCYHGLLVLQILVELINQGVALVDHTADVVENLCICVFLKFSKSVVECVVFPLFALQLVMHRLNLCVVALELAQDHVFVDSLLEPLFDAVKLLLNFRQLFRVRLLRLSLLEELRSLFPKLIYFDVESVEHWLEICLG